MQKQARPGTLGINSYFKPCEGNSNDSPSTAAQIVVDSEPEFNDTSTEFTRSDDLIDEVRPITYM